MKGPRAKRYHMDGPDKQDRDETARACADPRRKTACLHRCVQFGQIPVLMLFAADLQNFLFLHKEHLLAKFPCHHDNTAKFSCQATLSKLWSAAADCALILSAEYGIMPRIKWAG